MHLALTAMHCFVLRGRKKCPTFAAVWSRVRVLILWVVASRVQAPVPLVTAVAQDARIAFIWRPLDEDTKLAHIAIGDVAGIAEPVGNDPVA